MGAEYVGTLVFGALVSAANDTRRDDLSSASCAVVGVFVEAVVAVADAGEAIVDEAVEEEGLCAREDFKIEDLASAAAGTVVAVFPVFVFGMLASVALFCVVVVVIG